MAGRRNRKKSEKKTGIFYDYSLLFLVIFLIFFGLIMLYSTSYYSASIHQNDGMYYLKRQGSFAILGSALMLAVSKIDYRFLLKRIPRTKLYWSGVLLFISIVLQIYVLVAGDDINGAKRWISIAGVITFQPSDFAKIAIIIYTAYHIYLNPRLLDKFVGFVRIAIPVGIDIVLIATENLSTAIVITLIFGGMCFIASRNKTYFIFAIVFAFIAGALFIRFGAEFRMSRVTAWKNVETDSKAFQILQGLYAIASGGMFGKGLGNSMQKLGYVPEAQNDMIFTIICEELGVFGAGCVMLLFILLLCRIFQIAVNSPDLFGGMLCVGVLVHVAAQVLLNIAVVTNTIPSTGVALPFISYGGTSLAVLLAEMGLVLSVSNRVTI